MTSNQVFENCQLEKSHWKINNIVTIEYIILAWNQHSIFIYHYFNAKLLGICSKTPVWQMCDSCEILNLESIFKTTWLPTLLESVKILGWNTLKLLTGMQKSLHSLGFCTENLPLIQISSILSVNFTILWHRCQSVLMGQLHLSKACWELWLSDDQPHSDYNGQWQTALCILGVLQSSQPNPKRIKKMENVCYKTN